MTITILVLAAAAVAVIALYTTTVHPALRPVTVGAPAGQNTAVGLGDPAAETRDGGTRRASVVSDWQIATVSDLTAAEDLLDCLEAQGYEERELLILGNCAFGVRWR